MQGIRHQTVKARKTCRQLKIIVLDSAVKKRQRHLMFSQVSLQGFSYVSYASLVGFSYFTHASLVVVVIVTYFYWDYSRRSHLKPTTFGETELSGKGHGSQLLNLAASGDEASCKDERDSSKDERDSSKEKADSSKEETDSSEEETDSSKEEMDDDD